MNPDTTKQSKLHEVSNLIKTFAISRQKIAVKSNLVYTFDFTPTKVQHTARIYMYTRVNRSTLHSRRRHGDQVRAHAICFMKNGNSVHTKKPERMTFIVFWHLGFVHTYTGWLLRRQENHTGLGFLFHTRTVMLARL